MEKRSPIKEKPLRQAGQSLDEEINRIFSEEINVYIGYVFMWVFIAAVEWIRWFTKMPPHPLFVTFLFVIVVIYSVRKIVLFKQQVKRLELALQGERTVGQYLEILREKGYRVIHDIIGDGFNVDHVVIAPQGIFTIETKTASKPAKGESKIIFDGENILINGYKPERDPLIQAKAEAGWLKNLLKESTGKEYPVKPVVIYPDWWVDKCPKSDVWVLNQKALPSFIEHSKVILTPDEIGMAHSHIAAYIRSCNL